MYRTLKDRCFFWGRARECTASMYCGQTLCFRLVQFTGKSVSRKYCIY